MLGIAKRLNCAEINSNYSSTVAVGEFRNVWLVAFGRGICSELQFILDVCSTDRACALTPRVSAPLRRACLPPLVAGSQRDLWLLPR